MNMRNYYNYCCGTGDKMNEEPEDDNDGHESAQSHKEEKLGQHVFDTLPLTFHIKSGLGDAEYSRFVDYYRREQIKCQS